MNRIVSTIILVFAVLFLPVWVFVVGGLVAAFFFRDYFEIIPLCLLYDLLFGVNITIFSLNFFFFIVSFPVYFLIQFLKKNMLVFEDLQ